MKRQNQTVFYLEHLQPTWLSGDRMRQTYDRWAVRFPAILIGMLVGLVISSLVSPAFLPFGGFIGGFTGWLLSAGRTTPQWYESNREAKGGSWARLVEWLRIGSLIGVGAGLSFGLLLGLLNGLSFGLAFGLSLGLAFGLSCILLQAVLEKSNMAASRFQASQQSRKSKWQYITKNTAIRNGLIIGLLMGLSFGLSFGLSLGLAFGLLNGLIAGPAIGLFVGLSGGLSGGLLSGLLIGKPVGVILTDELVWSWRTLRRSLLTKRHLNTTLRMMALIGLSCGLVTGLGGGLAYRLRVGVGLDGALRVGLGSGLSSALAYGLSYGLSFWLLLGLVQGVSGETIGDHHRVVPNQGIRRSLRNSLVLGLVSTGIVWLTSTLSFVLSVVLSLNVTAEQSFAVIYDPIGTLSAALTDGLVYGLNIGPIIGLSAGLLAALLYGGLACLRHSVVRFPLWRAKSVPWNYPRFLDYATERVLLSKVGGGYIFVHRLLLEYFASLESTPTPDAARAKKEQVEPAS